MRFHQLHGKNISLNENRQIASRFQSFSNGMVFSERPIHPGEFFLIEIDETSDRWTGHLKIGFTALSPDEILQPCNKEVLYDHILQISVPNRPVTQCTCSCGLDRPLFKISSDEDCVHTPYASIRRQLLEPSRKENIYPTSVGSRIGVVYAFKQNAIHMHCVLNGIDYGPFSISKLGSSYTDTDYLGCPPKKRQRTSSIATPSINEHTKFWAFVDVYGVTERVRIIQLYGASTLKSLCRSVIVSHLSSPDRIGELSFGSQLKSYLKFHTS